MRQYFDINPHGTMPHKELWLRKTELIIALVSVIFSISIALLYKGGVKVAEASRHAAIVQAVIFIFPFICIARLIYVRMSKPVSWFGWLSPAIDIAVISSIIYVFSLQYGTAALL